MCQYSADNGHLTDWHLVNLGQYSARGASLSMIEASAVEPEGRITPQDAGIWDDSQIEPIRRIAEFIRSQNQHSAIQLAHAGRKASTLAPWLGGTGVSKEGDGWPDDVVGPSAIPYDATYSPCKELSIARIHDITRKFADSARRAISAGIEVIEIHGAHGYLFHNFHSPLSNKRTDDYGGSFENRVRFSLEVTRAVVQAIKDCGKEVPLFYRVSASDWVEGQESWTIEDTVKLVKLLQKEGVDLIDVSSAGNSTLQKIKTGPGYQVHFAEQIKRECPGILVGAVGMITNGPQANSIITEGKADVVLVAREFLRNPSLVLTMAKELDLEVKYPIQYHRAAWPKPQGAAFRGADSNSAVTNGTSRGASGEEAARASEKHHGGDQYNNAAKM